MNDCKWCLCEVCVNDACPACADYCPVAGEYWDICKYYEPVETMFEKEDETKIL